MPSRNLVRPRCASLTSRSPCCIFFFLNEPPTTEFSPLPLPAPLPIFSPNDPKTPRFLNKPHTYTIKTPSLARLLEGHEPFFLLVVRNPYTMVFRAVRRKPPAWRRDL